MNDTDEVTDEDKTAALCAATDYCREAIADAPVPPSLISEKAEEELEALESIHDEALAGWFERRDVDLPDEDIRRATKALWTWREHSLDEGDFEQAVQAEMALRDLKTEYP